MTSAELAILTDMERGEMKWAIKIERTDKPWAFVTLPLRYRIQHLPITDQQ
jgi:hypothetical protein